MPRQKVHLVNQDVAVAEDQVFRFIGYVRCVQELHAGLLGGATAFSLVAGSAGGDYIHPDIAPALGYRHDVVACQAQAGQPFAAVGADVLIAVKQLAIVEWRHLVEMATIECAALDGDDAVGADFRALASHAADAAMDGEAVLADAPGHQILGVVEARVLPRYPAMWDAMGVEREDQGVCAHGAKLNIRLTISPNGDYQSIVTMGSSLQHNEQRPETLGFPLSPLVLSLALHAGVLVWWLPQAFDDAFSVPAATVLRGELLPAPPKVADVAPHAVPAPGHFIPPEPTFSRAIAPASITRQRPEATPGLPVSAAVQNAGDGVLPQETAAPAHGVLTADVVVADSAPDLAGLRQFRLSLAGEARRFRRYPEAARRAGLVGTAEVRVAVEAGGLKRHANLTRSSGHAALDTAALEMLQQAASRAVLPESLRGQSFAVLLPVVFEVEE